MSERKETLEVALEKKAEQDQRAQRVLYISELVHRLASMFLAYTPGDYRCALSKADIAGHFFDVAQIEKFLQKIFSLTVFSAGSVHYVNHQFPIPYQEITAGPYNVYSNPHQPYLKLLVELFVRKQLIELEIDLDSFMELFRLECPTRKGIGVIPSSRYYAMKKPFDDLWDKLFGSNPGITNFNQTLKISIKSYLKDRFDPRSVEFLMHQPEIKAFHFQTFIYRSWDDYWNSRTPHLQKVIRPINTSRYYLLNRAPDLAIVLSQALPYFEAQMLAIIMNYQAPCHLTQNTNSVHTFLLKFCEKYPTKIEVIKVQGTPCEAALLLQSLKKEKSFLSHEKPMTTSDSALSDTSELKHRADTVAVATKPHAIHNYDLLTALALETPFLNLFPMFQSKNLSKRSLDDCDGYMKAKIQAKVKGNLFALPG